MPSEANPHPISQLTSTPIKNTLSKIYKPPMKTHSKINNHQRKMPVLSRARSRKANHHSSAPRPFPPSH
jgi:hypothetical protein